MYLTDRQILTFWQTFLPDRLFRDFALKYYLLTPYHIHGYLSISAIDYSLTFDTKQNLPSHYFTRRMQQSFFTETDHCYHVF
ncbi:hypothetical protein CP500_006675 [Tychonema bourrellyi FEM_GT703]|uniref:Uncharacterized protein n=1 Tax=Tychonema bourrellyi FEM_GT703 TaxID=2040638 RepID=A0A2G4F3X8_9CYAN|nr:hypothetical protein CP500_006675 [Tychonema bourrellyi FEM_GT703]